MSAIVMEYPAAENIPVPQTPDAVIFTNTSSPVSLSGFVVEDFLGMPSLAPLNTVKVGMVRSVYSFSSFG
jgi:hypothetical protein